MFAQLIKLFGLMKPQHLVYFTSLLRSRKEQNLLSKYETIKMFNH